MVWEQSSVDFDGFSFVNFIDEEKIALRVQELANQISTDYAQKDPLFIVVLNGSFVFAADLLRKITFDCKSIFVKLKSYDGFESTGKVEELLGIQEDISGKDIIIIEDIVDTGKTLNDFILTLHDQKVASIEVVTLLFKKDPFRYKYPIKYKGFEIQDRFVIGYGMDYNNQGRNLPAIFVKKD